MATEALYVPEENLSDTIDIIRAGIQVVGKFVSYDTVQALTQWCDEEEAYWMGGRDDD